VGGRIATLFTLVFRPTPNCGLRSRPSSVRHANLSLAAGVQRIGNEHDAIDNWPLAFALDGPISLALGFSCQPSCLRRGEVDRFLDGAALNNRCGAHQWLACSWQGLTGPQGFEGARYRRSPYRFSRSRAGAPQWLPVRFFNDGRPLDCFGCFLLRLRRFRELHVRPPCLLVLGNTKKSPVVVGRMQNSCNGYSGTGI
jgi:hypothetical protein